MKEVLRNLALIDLMTFCRKENIACSGTHLEKKGRGFTYNLCQDNGKPIVSVTFYKNSAPTHLIY